MREYVPVGEKASVVAEVVCVEDDPSVEYPCPRCCFWGILRSCRKYECRSGYRKDGKGVHFELREKGC